MSKMAKGAMVLVVVAAVTLAIIARRGPESSDAQAGLVIPFLIFWTILALLAIGVLDAVIRALWRRSSTPPS